jgi:hypothetical protein
MKRALVLLFLVAVLLLSFSATAVAGPFGLWKSDFKMIASGGQGDWKNIYAWSMASYKGDLYVGTARQAAIAPVMEFMTGAMPGFSMPPDAFPSDSAPFFREFLRVSPGSMPQIIDEQKFERWNAASCAEIWRLHNGCWTKVYTVPRVPAMVLDTNGHQALIPSLPTYDPTAKVYLTPVAVGFRNMVAFTDANGMPGVYASGGSFSLGMSPGASYNNNLLFGSTDGATWSQLLTPSGMGRETRALGVHHGKLYAGIGTAMNSAMGMPAAPGSVWCSATPTVKESWTKVLDFPTSSAPGNTGVMAMTSCNDRLYIGTENSKGFEVWRSRVADPAVNADWKQLVTDGAGDRYNAWAGTMKTFRNNVYVGSMAVPGITGELAMKSFDLIRIKPDDCWQLLVGDRDPQTPVAGASRRRALSGWPSGFGMPTNLYCWNMEVYKGWLYVGSMDMSSMLRAASESGMEMPDMGIPPTILNLVLQVAGFDLWKTADGIFWLPVNLKGMGDWRNYGARTIREHAGKLYIGTANPFRGFQVWEGYDR